MGKLLALIGDITLMTVDVIVNAVNRQLCDDAGVNGAIHRAAGPELYDECIALGEIATGEAEITNGYNLPARFVIHTPGPIHGIEHGREAELLANCYRNSMALAAQKNLKSIAFPCISTGAYGYPKEEAAKIAVTTIKEFFSSNKSSIEYVYFVTFEWKNFNAYCALLT